MFGGLPGLVTTWLPDILGRCNIAATQINHNRLGPVVTPSGLRRFAPRCKLAPGALVIATRLPLALRPLRGAVAALRLLPRPKRSFGRVLLNASSR